MQPSINLSRAVALLPSLTVYRNLSSDPTLKAFQELLEELNRPDFALARVLSLYHKFCSYAVQGPWPEHLIDLLIKDENFLSREAGATGFTGINPLWLKLALRDLQILRELANIKSNQLKGIIADSATLGTGDDFLAPGNWPGWEQVLSPSPEIPSPDSQPCDAQSWVETSFLQLKLAFLHSGSWEEMLRALADYYQAIGCGVFARHVAFSWQGEREGLKGIAKPDPIRLTDLIGLQRELGIILANTEQFLQGSTAHNLILYGNRGTGKSSAIKALVHEYAHQGLRLVELPKDKLADFPRLISLLATVPKKFIIFVDDLSFEADDANYRALKTVLEGTLEAKPANVIVYATSNRRHLIKEYHSDRVENEIHLRDSMEEKLALADRFGITVTFVSPDQKEYLTIVEGLAMRRNLQVEPSELRQMALRWELQHNGRSGRTARQFVDHLAATLGK